MRKAVKMLRPGHVIVMLNGGQSVVREVRTVRSDRFGELIEFTLENGLTFRRTPGSRVDVYGKVRKRRRRKT